MIYGPVETPIYLDLGGALAAFGLIFAVYQLRKPQWDLVLNIRDKWQGNLFWIFGGIGLLLTLIRVLVSETYIFCLPFSFELLPACTAASINSNMVCHPNLAGCNLYPACLLLP